MGLVYVCKGEYFGEKAKIYVLNGSIVCKTDTCDCFINISDCTTIPERRLPNHLRHLIHEYKMTVDFNTLLDKLFESMKD